jgi:hypothetical protein
MHDQDPPDCRRASEQMNRLRKRELSIGAGGSKPARTIAKNKSNFSALC